MTRKKNTTRETPSAANPDRALLDALRSNLSLLGELAVRYEVETHPERPKGDLPAISSPDDVRRLLAPEMAHLLDTKNNVVGQRVVYQGNINSSVVRPAEVLRPAVVEGVPSIIVSHNHPSADPTPSPEDVAITRELAQAAKLLSIELLDHIIIGGDRAVSLKERASCPDASQDRPPSPALTRGTAPCASTQHTRY